MRALRLCRPSLALAMPELQVLGEYQTGTSGADRQNGSDASADRRIA